jgi:hypothetical protein
LLTNQLVIIGAIGSLLVGSGILLYGRKTPTKQTTYAVIAGIFFGITTNVVTYYVLQEADRAAESVAVEPIRERIMADQNFTVSGSATIADDRHQLWVVVYRPSGGFDIANRSSVPVMSDGTWVLDLVRVGRPPEEAGQQSPDAGLTYTVSAVIVDEQGAADLEVAVDSVPNPTDSVFVNKSRPSGIIDSDSTEVRPA